MIKIASLSAEMGHIGRGFHGLKLDINGYHRSYPNVVELLL
jgi:hypothetical protein